MNTWLRYIDHPLARSWVYFNRANTQFEASLQEKDTSLTWSIQKLDSAIDWYLESLNIRETPEARANLEAAQKNLKLLKNEESERNKIQEEEQDNAQNENNKSDDQRSDASEGGSKDESKSESGSTEKEENKNGDKGGAWGSESRNPDKNTTDQNSPRADSKKNDTKPEGRANESSSNTSTWPNQDRSWVLGYTNTGTFSEGFSGSTSGSGLSLEDEKTLKNSVEFLKELQKDRDKYTRPKWWSDMENGTESMFQKYFGDTPLFKNERDADPYDY